MLTKEEVAGMRNGELIYCAYRLISYRDTFDKNHEESLPHLA
jgi:hypothetical protein